MLCPLTTTISCSQSRLVCQQGEVLSRDFGQTATSCAESHERAAGKKTFAAVIAHSPVLRDEFGNRLNKWEHPLSELIPELNH